MSISNFDDVIDSRDVIDRIEELESELMSSYEYYLNVTNTLEEELLFLDWIKTYAILEDSKIHSSDDAKEYLLLQLLSEEGRQYSDDWEYGAQIIRETYFKEYMDDMVQDCYTLPKDMPWWMSIKLDYEALKQDYTEIEFDGVTYYVR